MLILSIGVDGLGLPDAKKYGFTDLFPTFSWTETYTYGYTLPGVASFLSGQPRDQHEIGPHGFRGCKQTVPTREALRKWDTYLPTAVENAGFRIGLGGLPLTFPAHPVNGWMYGSLLTPSNAVGVWPPEYASKVEFTGMVANERDKIIESDRHITDNAIELNTLAPVDVLCVYYSGWNRAYPNREWRGDVMEALKGEIRTIYNYGVETLGADLCFVWSDHGNKDQGEGSIHTKDGLFGMADDGQLPQYIEQFNHLIINHLRAKEEAIWDRITRGKKPTD